MSKKVILKKKNEILNLKLNKKFDLYFILYIYFTF